MFRAFNKGTEFSQQTASCRCGDGMLIALLKNLAIGCRGNDFSVICFDSQVA
jgi:hypothetical protein